MGLIKPHLLAPRSLGSVHTGADQSRREMKGQVNSGSSFAPLPDLSHLDFLFTFDTPQQSGDTANDVSSHTRTVGFDSGVVPLVTGAGGVGSAVQLTGSHKGTMSSNSVNALYVNNTDPGHDWTYNLTMVLSSDPTFDAVPCCVRNTFGAHAVGYYVDIFNDTTVGKIEFVCDPYAATESEAGYFVTFPLAKFDDDFHTISIVCDTAAGPTGAVLHFYLDGVSLGSATRANTTNPDNPGSSDLIVLGAIPASGGPHYHGCTMQDLNLWNTTFSPPQALTMYQLLQAGERPKTFLGL